MTAIQIFAFIVLPLVVLGLGYAAVRWNEWDIKRHDKLHPGE